VDSLIVVLSEPAKMMFVSLGGLALFKKRKAQKQSSLCLPKGYYSTCSRFYYLLFYWLDAL